MVLAEQFLAGILGNLAKFVVDVCDAPARVGDGHDGMRIQRRFQVVQFLDRAMAPRRCPRRRGRAQRAASKALSLFTNSALVMWE